jgi:hypothetical protein
LSGKSAQCARLLPENCWAVSACIWPTVRHESEKRDGTTPPKPDDEGLHRKAVHAACRADWPDRSPLTLLPAARRKPRQVPDPIKARISLTRHTVTRAPSLRGFGKRPSLTPAHHVDLLIGIGPTGARMSFSRTRPVSGNVSMPVSWFCKVRSCLTMSDNSDGTGKEKSVQVVEKGACSLALT